MSFQYYVTTQKPTGVNACVSGNISSPDQLNLIIAKNNWLDFFLVCPEGLTLLKEIYINGKIDILKAFRYANAPKDSLFIVTAKGDAFILECELEGNNLKIHTKAQGNILEKYLEAPEAGRIAAIDPLAKVIALRLSEGLLKIIPLESGPELRAVNLRLEEQDIRDFNFLHGFPTPTFVFLHADSYATHIKATELSLKDYDFTNVLWKQDHVEMDASMIVPIPEPIGGVIIIGKETILYHNGSFFIAVSPSQLGRSDIICHAIVDVSGRRHVLANMMGNLFMLLLETNDGTSEEGSQLVVKDIKLELLGDISIPECICYLDNGVFFVGSRLGDSQLIKLNKLADLETNSYISVLDTFVNLGPIVDMAVVNLDGQRQDQLITCSGAGKEGSLRIIRNGITVHEQATIELEGIKGLWPLSIKSDSKMHNILIISFVKHTKVLALNGEDVEETEIFGIPPDQQTLYCNHVNESTILLVTETSISLISLNPTEEILYEWKPPAAKSIDLVSSNNTQIICALGNLLFYLEVDHNKIVEKTKRVMEHEVACIDVSPSGHLNYGKYVVVGLWNDISVRVLQVPSLDEVFCEYLGGEIIPRSIIFSNFDDLHYVFCGLGNGTIIHFLFKVDDGSLSERNQLVLGTQPVIFKSFQSANSTMIFACSDLPTVIFSRNQKLIFPHVNVPGICTMSSLNSDAFPESVALVTDHTIIIATMNEFQKLHIRSIPLCEAPKRIAYQESSQTFGVVSFRTDSMETSKEQFSSALSPASLRALHKSQSQSALRNLASTAVQHHTEPDAEVYNFLLLESNTFAILHAHQMFPNEYCLSLISAQLGKNKTPYYVVGTAFIDPEESEPKTGRILILEAKDGKVNEIAEECVKGACYALCELNGKLVAGIGSSIRIFEWTDEESLRLECSYFNNILALYIKVKGDFILIGDIMRSMTLIQYKSIEGNLVEICRDFSPAWMTAIEILDDDTFVGCENSFNIFLCRKNSAAVTDEERERIEVEGIFHVGDLVNVIRRGSMAVPVMESSLNSKPASYILGTVSGSLGVLITLTKPLYDLLLELQARLASTISTVGNISHEQWRGSTRPLIDDVSSNFIDGDLIESMLDLPRREITQLISGFKKPGSTEDVTLDEIIKTVENLSRLH